MKGSFSWRRRRLSVYGHAWALNLPRLCVLADGDFVALAFSYGNGNSDPVFGWEVDLSGTWMGRWLSSAYWRLRDRRRRRS